MNHADLTDAVEGQRAPGESTSSQRSVGAGSGIRWFLSPAGLAVLVLVALTVIGGYARFEALGSVSLWADESQSTLYAFSILSHGYPVIVSKHLINNWEPLYPYLEAVSIAALGHSNFAYRLPSALVGTALIPLSYLIGSRLRDRYVGVALAGMVALSTEYIAWSRQARWYMLLTVVLALGLLAVVYWNRARTRRSRAVCVGGMVAVVVTGFLTSPGVFLLYAPGILFGALAFLAVVRWRGIRRFFRGPAPDEASSTGPAPPLVPYRFRLWIVVLLVLAGAAVLVAEAPVLAPFFSRVVARLIGFPPFPPSLSGFYAEYLISFYPAIVGLSIASVFWIGRRRDPLEIGLLAFCAGALVGVSVGSSITTNIAGGTAPDFERHLVPLLFFLFLLSAVSIVEILRWMANAVGHSWPSTRRWRRAAPALFGIAIVVMLVVPSAVVPTSNVLYHNTRLSAANSLVPWVAFSPAPEYPSALYESLQPNYQLASDYVLAHRVPGEVVGATTTGPPTVYLGSVQYWIRGDPNRGTEIVVNGQTEFFYTGSVLVNNTTDLEELLYRSPGWLISDIPRANGPDFAGGMAQVVSYFMTRIPEASDGSISLFHWNQSTPLGLVDTLIREDPTLNKSLGTKTLQSQLWWVVTRGVTTYVGRPVLVPLAPLLFPLILNRTTLGLGVLINVYNHRGDLEQAFPEVLEFPTNETRILAWACEVASGNVPDPSYPTLAPYRSAYCG